MKLGKTFAFAAASLLFEGAAHAGSPVPYGYNFVGNAVVKGGGACVNASGTFPANVTLTVDSVTGFVDSYFLSFEISNPNVGLPTQTILTGFATNNPGSFVAYDPQLLGNSTALTGVAGTVVSGSFTSPTSGSFGLGSGFGTSNPVPVVLSAPTAIGPCTLSLTGILYARAN